MSDYGDDFEDDDQGYASDSSYARSSAAASTPDRHHKQHKHSSSVASSSAAADRMSKLTPEERAALEDAQRQHAKLKDQLRMLNNDLDDQLTRRGHTVGRIRPQTKPNQALERLIAANEQRRAENNELNERLHQADGIVLVATLRNKVGAAENDRAKLKDENQSLENVFSNQQKKTAVADRIDADLKAKRDEHNADLKRMKDEGRVHKEEREKELQQFRQLRRQQDRLDEKLRVQETAGEAVKSVDSMEEQLEDKDRMIESLKYQVAVLSKTNTAQKDKQRSRNSKMIMVVDELRAERARLKHQVEKQRL